MGQWFKLYVFQKLTLPSTNNIACSINFDKHQVHESQQLRKFGEFGGNEIVRNLIALQPYDKLHTALKRIFL